VPLFRADHSLLWSTLALPLCLVDVHLSDETGSRAKKRLKNGKIRLISEMQSL